METSFPKWLEERLIAQGLSQADLARKSGVTAAQISRIISGSRGAEGRTLAAIANALKLPPEEVYRAAGYMPPKTDKNPIVEQITYLASNLPEAEQQDILEFIKLRHRLAEERGTYETKRTKKPAHQTK